MRTRDLFLLKI